MLTGVLQAEDGAPRTYLAVILSRSTIPEKQLGECHHSAGSGQAQSVKTNETAQGLKQQQRY